jgi:hypothetical protein
MRQHAGNCGMNLNSHYLMRAVNLQPTARQAAANFTSAAASGYPPQMHQVEDDKEAAAGEGSHSSSSSNGDSLAEAVAYSAAAAASGSIRVVLSVPDEAPPTDRNGKEWWPAGWQPALADTGQEVARSAGAFGSTSGTGAAGVGHTSAAAAAAGASSGGGIAWDAGKQTASVQRIDVGASDRAKLAALVESGAGSDRGIVREQDLFELLGLPYLEPNQRNC